MHQIANLSDAQFTTLVIRMLTEWVEFVHKLDEKMKAMLSEIKENVEGTKRWEGNQDSNQWYGPEGRNKNSKK